MTLGAGDLALLAAAGLVAGAVNAVGGGGSLVSFPALLAVGYSPLAANVTNLVAVLPGYVGGAVGYRAELRGQRARTRTLSLAAAAGAAVGSALLLLGPAAAFEALAPWLVLVACALLAVGPAVGRLVTRAHRGHPAPRGLVASIGLASIYGGYFGAGLGIVFLAVLGLLLDDDLQRLNAVKQVLSLVVAVVTGLAVALFGPVAWGPALLMGASSLVGGRAGVVVARRLPAAVLRWSVIALGIGVAVALLAR